MAPGFFFTLLRAFFPFFFPLQARNVLDEGLHPVCAGSLHLLRDMPIYVQSKRCGVMSQISLDGLDIVTCPNSGNRIAVSKVMKSGIRQANRSVDPLELMIHCMRHRSHW